MQQKQKGGIVFEYLLVTIFTFIISSLIFAAIAKTYNDKIQKLSEQIGVNFEEITWKGF